MKIKIKPIIIVEGKYDKIKLESLVDGIIVAVDGFEIFKDKTTQKNLLSLSQENGAIILTDSDRAGFQIRKFLHDILNSCTLYDLYIPDIFGKEKRKASFSAEKKLGVEGVPTDILRKLLRDFSEDVPISCDVITTKDLYEFGLFGNADSAQKRREFQVSVGLPGRLNKNMLLKVLNTMFSKEQLKEQMYYFLNKKDPQ